MKLLLDTHVLLWWWSGDKRLSREAARLLAKPTSELLVSPVSALEVAIKDRVGKLGRGENVIARFEELVAAHDLTVLPVTLAHALRAGGYPAAHRDPFDRLLAAQSELDDAPLVTSDAAIAAFPCRVRW